MQGVLPGEAVEIHAEGRHTVVEIATGREHGPYDSEADVALCLVFEKLGRDQVEVLCDASPMSSYTAPPW